MGKLHSYEEDISFYHIDEHAKKGQRNNFQSVDELVSYLSEGIPHDTDHREILLTRGFLVWYTYASMEDFTFISEELRLLKVQRMFHLFCQCADIESKQINGIGKGGPSNAFSRTFASHNWNAFKADNTWHLVEPRWCVERKIGYQAGGVVALETDGNTGMKQVEFRAGRNEKAFDGQWFCTKPNIFLYRHFPDDPTWQLLPKHDSDGPMSFEMWSDVPYLSSSFFEHDLRLLSEESVRLKTINGKTTIMLMGKDAKKYTFPYKLYLKESDASTINPTDLPRLVFPMRDGDIFKFEIRLPVRGTYFIDLILHDIQSKKYANCAQFMIECDEADPNCKKLPVDTGILGFGYGPVAEEAGLKKPSIKGSKVILKSETDGEGQSKSQTISLKIDADAVNEYEYGSQIYEDENQEPVTTVVNEFKRQLEIFPPVRPDNEYALMLFHRRKHTDERFKPVLFYMVTTDEDETDENQILAQQKRKEILYEEKKQDKMAKNFELKEKIRTMRATIGSLSKKGSHPEDSEEHIKEDQVEEPEETEEHTKENQPREPEEVTGSDWFTTEYEA